MDNTIDVPLPDKAKVIEALANNDDDRTTQDWNEIDEAARWAQAVYLGRRGTHFVFRLTLQGKPIVAYYPAWLVDRRGPHPIDCTTVALNDERMPPSVPVSEG